jgi:CMP/dCMP kinase
MTQDPIAIDGPAASGKSTVARGVAAGLGRLYVDSGALYRGFTWQVVRRGVDPADTPAVLRLLAATDWTFRVEQGAWLQALDGDDPGLEIRKDAVGARVSIIAAIPEVRACVVDRLRSADRFGPVVMEGRDIGTVVFPDTPWKFYLDASPEVRAQRRLRDVVALEGGGTVEAVDASLRRRDTLDSTRATAPLRIAPDAEVIDSSSMTAEAVIARILARVRG